MLRIFRDLIRVKQMMLILKIVTMKVCFETITIRIFISALIPNLKCFVSDRWAFISL